MPRHNLKDSRVIPVIIINTCVNKLLFEAVSINFGYRLIIASNSKLNKHSEARSLRFGKANTLPVKYLSTISVLSKKLNPY